MKKVNFDIQKAKSAVLYILENINQSKRDLFNVFKISKNSFLKIKNDNAKLSLLVTKTIRIFKHT